MAFGFVQGIGANATTFTGDHTLGTNVMAFGASNAANNMLVCAIGTWDSPPPGKAVSSIADTAGNTWSTANRIATISSYDSQTRLELWWIPTCLGGANTVTVTFPSSTMYKMCYVAEYSGAGGGLLDAFVFNADPTSPSVSAHTSGNTSAIATGDLVLGLYADAGNTSTPSVTDGKTSRATFTGGTTAILSDLLSSTAGEQSASFNTSVAFYGVSLCACFKATARAAPTVTMAAAG